MVKKSPKFERCVKKVKSKQSLRCRKNKWKGKGCYNPWAVCHSSIGKKRRSIKRQNRKIHTGPRGGKYYIVNKNKYYI